MARASSVPEAGRSRCSATARTPEVTTAHLWVESPTERVGSEGSGILEFSSWFNTHPPMRSRIAALEEAGGFRLPERLVPGEPFAAELSLAG